MKAALGRLASTHGMLGVLVALCVYFAWATYHQDRPGGAAGGESLAAELVARPSPAGALVVVVPDDATGTEFASAFERRMAAGGRPVDRRISGDPPTVRGALAAMRPGGRSVAVVATTDACSQWTLWAALRREDPSFAGVDVRAPSPLGVSTFLTASNLRNVADQIAVIAIIAVGMTLVILTAGIDLSVGSLVALSAVVTAWLIRAWGGSSASGMALLGACAAATTLCGGMGIFSGFMITVFRIPPFIATLAMMQVASGLAFIIARGHSIYDIPGRFVWLGRGTDLAGIPNAVVLMLLAYVGAHILMTRTALGRRVYAVGGNAEASRLSGVSVRRTTLFVYLVAGLAAGIGGVVTASQLKAGSPTYGLSYELYVIAAVVVGGTSLAGGEGRIAGTLIGALIIGVIRNGMNLTNIEPYTQKVVLGLVILGAVLLDMLKRRGARAAG